MIIVSLLCLLTFQSFSQQMLIDTFYVDKNELLIHSQKETFDSLTMDKLNIRVKNWAGNNFRSMKDVLVSETPEQLVFNYITDAFYIKSLGMKTYCKWYIRMVVQIKDGKIRVLMYDGGNAFWPGSYSSGVSTPSTPAGRYRFSDYFDKDGSSRKMYQGGFNDIKTHCKATTNDLIKSINSDTKVNKNDW